MSNKIKKALIFIVSCVAFAAIDQLTKLAAYNKLNGKEPFVIIDGVLEFTYITNNGAAWGMMSGQRFFFIILTIIIMAGIVYAYSVTPWNRKYALLTFIEILGFSGAAGNFIDRCVNGYVHDFIYFKLIDFPVFNVADCYVVIAAILLIFSCFFVYREEHDFDFLSLKKK